MEIQFIALDPQRQRYDGPHRRGEHVLLAVPVPHL